MRPLRRLLDKIELIPAQENGNINKKGPYNIKKPVVENPEGRDLLLNIYSSGC